MALDKSKYTIKEALEIISKHMKALADESIKKGLAGPKPPSESQPSAAASASLHTRDKSSMQGNSGKKPTMDTAFQSLNKEESSASGSKSASASASKSKSLDKADTAIEEASSSAKKLAQEAEKEMSLKPGQKGLEASGTKSESSSSGSKSLSKMEADNDGAGGV